MKYENYTLVHLIVYIGIYDDVYKYDPPGPYSVNIIELLKKHFNNTRVLEKNTSQWLIEAKNGYN